MSLREECPQLTDNLRFDEIVHRLREEFLFIALDDFTLEVHEQDVEPIRQQLQQFTSAMEAERRR